MDTKPIPAPGNPTAWDRFRGGFLQAWSDNSPNRSWWGRAQGYVVAAALCLAGLLLGSLLVATVVGLLHG